MVWEKEAKMIDLTEKQKEALKNIHMAMYVANMAGDFGREAALTLAVRLFDSVLSDIEKDDGHFFWLAIDLMIQKMDKHLELRQEITPE